MMLGLRHSSSGTILRSDGSAKPRRSPRRAAGVVVVIPSANHPSRPQAPTQPSPARDAPLVSAPRAREVRM